MGRYSWSNRRTVEGCLCLSISKLKEWDYLCGYKAGTIQWKNASGEVTDSIGIAVSVSLEGYGEDDVQLTYSMTDRTTGEKKDLDYKIELVSTPCHFGGVRWWLICPLWKNSVFCSRRVGKLYLPGNATYFGCRDCYNLTYRSCKEHSSHVSALEKLPPGEVQRLLRSEDPRELLRGTKAWLKMFKKR
ncbi:MAG: hypothetical protein WBF13_10770 [Candidatus Zixiibacteriota bacterium]